MATILDKIIRLQRERSSASLDLTTVIEILKQSQEEGGNLSLGVVDASASTLILDMQSLSQRLFKSSGIIAAPKTWLLANVGNSFYIPSFTFSLSGLHAQTMPSNFKMSDARWDSVGKIWTPLDTGEYRASLIYDGTSWLLTIDQNSGPFI